MTQIAKIALVNSEVDIAIEALDNAADSYDDDGQTVRRDIALRAKKKILDAVKKYDKGNKQVIHDVTKPKS